jgi:hypothetical protein
MRKIQHIAYASILALVLYTCVLAGDITVSKALDTSTKSTTLRGDITVSKSANVTTTLVEIIQGLFSILP